MHDHDWLFIFLHWDELEKLFVAVKSSPKPWRYISFRFSVAAHISPMSIDLALVRKLNLPSTFLYGSLRHCNSCDKHLWICRLTEHYFLICPVSLGCRESFGLCFEGFKIVSGLAYDTSELYRLGTVHISICTCCDALLVKWILLRRSSHTTVRSAVSRVPITIINWHASYCTALVVPWSTLISFKASWTALWPNLRAFVASALADHLVAERLFNVRHCPHFMRWYEF